MPSENMMHLADTLRALKGKRIVLCHGVFDLLHIGHIRYLRQAKEHGDVLVVTITPDRFVDKGPGRPAFPEQLRLEAIASLNCVDFAAINAWPTAEETLRLLRPHVYAKGAEFRNCEDITGKIALEQAVVSEVGAEMVFVEDVVFSSSNLINRHLTSLSDETSAYLQQLRTRIPLQLMLEYLQSLHDLRVLIIGDSILDEYIYCSPLGASSKDPVLAVQYENKEVFAGGALAVANHVVQHAGEVDLISVIGDDDKEAFIRSQLDPRIRAVLLSREGMPTLTKSRILSGYSFQKLLEVYYMEASALPAPLEAQLSQHVLSNLDAYDIVIAADFGHGCISSRLAVQLSEKVPFFAVNTQANAGNRGYHTISRYPRADFISLAGHEINMEYRNEKLPLIEMMTNLQHRLHCPTVLVTEGRNGCAVLGEEFVRAPSFASRVVDRVGAGDALFSVAALGACKGLPLELLGFLGNIAGSLAVETIGNAKAVSKEAMQKYITAIMK